MKSSSVVKLLNEIEQRGFDKIRLALICCNSCQSPVQIFRRFHNLPAECIVGVLLSLWHRRIDYKPGVAKLRFVSQSNAARVSHKPMFTRCKK